MLQSDKHLSTSSPMTSMSADSSTLLHVSICVGPSWGQIFFMWFKSLFGGRLHSYDVVLDYGHREVLLRLNQQAKALGCSSMVNIRIEMIVSFARNNNSSKTSSVEFWRSQQVFVVKWLFPFISEPLLAFFCRFVGVLFVGLMFLWVNVQSGMVLIAEEFRLDVRKKRRTSSLLIA